MARAFAAEGARVFAPGRALVDALDEDTVTSHAAEVRTEAGSIDICFNAVGMRLSGIPETAERLGSHTARMWERAAERLGVPYEQLLEQVGAGTYSGRPLTVQQVADLAVFLASDRASCLTGTVVNVTGGSVVD